MIMITEADLSSESQTAKEQASFMKQLESRLYCECAKCIVMQ